MELSQRILQTGALSAAGCSISELLTQMYDKCRLLPLQSGGALRNISTVRAFPPKEIQKVAHALDLVDFLWKSEEERNAAIACVKEESERLKCVQVFTNMDGRVTRATAFLQRQTSVGARRKAYAVGIGNSISKDGNWLQLNHWITPWLLWDTARQGNSVIPTKYKPLLCDDCI
jgi:hypothetical protein